MPESRIIRIQPAVAMLFCVLCLGLFAHRLWIELRMPDGGSAVGVAYMAFLLLLAGGLWRRHWLALRSAAAISLLLAILLPPGTFNVFSAGDYLAAGIEPPTILSALVWLIPAEIFLLFGAYVLDLRKPVDLDAGDGR